MTDHILGVDISKANLDVHLCRQARLSSSPTAPSASGA